MLIKNNNDTDGVNSFHLVRLIYSGNAESVNGYVGYNDIQNFFATITLSDLAIHSQFASWNDRRAGFQKSISARNLFHSKEELISSIKYVDKISSMLHTPGCEQIRITQSAASKLQRAKSLKHSAIHPDWERFYKERGEDVLQAQIPRVFRYSGFYFFNTLMVSALLINPGASILGVGGARIFWSWMNQTYNTGLDYSNRGVSSQEMERLTSGKDQSHLINPQIDNFVKHSGSVYATAVATACSVNWFVSERLPKYFPILSRASLRFLPPTIACFGAHGATMYFSCYRAWRHGVNVFDENGKVIQVTNEKGENTSLSKKAGLACLNRNMLQRVVTLVAAMAIPTVGITMIEKNTTLFKRYPRVKLPAFLTLVVGTLYAVLPWTISYYPQQLSISTNKLEKEFQGLQTISGIPIREVYVNKGL